MGFRELLASADAAAGSLLGEPVTYTPGTGSPVVVDGIFDENAVLLEVGTPGASSQSPAVFLQLVDLPSDPMVDLDATVTIRGVEYGPWKREPDGQGAILLRLHKVV